MAISRAQQLKELLPGLHALFGLEYKRYPEEWKSLFAVNKSDRSFEEETKLSGFGVPGSKSEGQAINYDTAQEAWTARYTPETVAMGFALTEEAMEDNLYDSLGPRYVKAMAKAMTYAKEVRGASVFNNAFSGSYLGGDGVALCSTAHPLVGGGTNSNRPVSGADLTETSLEAALIAISKWTDERGLLVAAKAKKLAISTDNDYVATRLLKTELRSSVQGSAPTFAPNDVNAIYTMGAIPEGYAVNHYFTDTNAWFLTTDVADGFKHFVRVPYKTSSEADFDTGNMRFKARERYVFGWSDPLCVYGSPGST